MDLRTRLFDCNRRFYEAFQRADPDGMAGVWLHEDWVKFVHPGWPMIVGWGAIAASWQRIFADRSAFDIAIEHVSGHVERLSAWITCVERVQKVNLVQATNVFLCRDGAWKMIHHHASAAPGVPVNGAHPSAEGED